MSLIRAATFDDLDAIAAIWNPIIRDTDITFTSQEKSRADLRDFLTEHQTNLDPVLVLELNGSVAGYATFHPFRAGPGYAQTREISIALAPNAQRSGHGQALIEALEEQARDLHLHVMVAGITDTNAGSLHFFSKLGYAIVGRMPQVGRKFERYHNLVLMQKIL